MLPPLSPESARLEGCTTYERICVHVCVCVCGCGCGVVCVLLRLAGGATVLAVLVVIKDGDNAVPERARAAAFGVRTLQHTTTLSSGHMCMLRTL